MDSASIRNIRMRDQDAIGRDVVAVVRPPPQRACGTIVRLAGYALHRNQLYGLRRFPQSRAARLPGLPSSSPRDRLLGGSRRGDDTSNVTRVPSWSCRGFVRERVCTTRPNRASDRLDAGRTVHRLDRDEKMVVFHDKGQKAHRSAPLGNSASVFPPLNTFPARRIVDEEGYG